MLKLNTLEAIISVTVLLIQIQHLLKLNNYWRKVKQKNSRIQIQHLLKLNGYDKGVAQLAEPDSNTTLVKVKYSKYPIYHLK